MDLARKYFMSLRACMYITVMVRIECAIVKEPMGWHLADQSTGEVIDTAAFDLCCCLVVFCCEYNIMIHNVWNAMEWNGREEMFCVSWCVKAGAMSCQGRCRHFWNDSLSIFASSLEHAEPTLQAVCVSRCWWRDMQLTGIKTFVPEAFVSCKFSFCSTYDLSESILDWAFA